MQEVKYPYEVEIGTKKLKVRKWKAKDRKIFKKNIKDLDNFEKAIIDSLVYSCLENKNIALTNKEVQYLFIELRKLSIGDEFNFSYTCDCGHKNNLELKISDVCRPTFEEYKIIKTKSTEIELQDIKNKEFYEDNSDEFDDIKELAFRVKSLNNDNTKSFKDIVAYLEDMDIMEFDDLFEQFSKINFNIDNFYDCECSECKKKTTFEFDEIPGFLPDSWN